MTAIKLATKVDERRDHFAAALTACGLVICVAAIYWADVQALWSRWADAIESNLMLFVAPLVPWLIWRQRRVLAIEDGPSPLAGVVALVLVGLLWDYARAAQVEIARQALLPVFAWLAIYTALGWDSAKRLFFPLAWVWCAVFDWGVLTNPLQSVTAGVSGFLPRLIGIPTNRDGFLINVPAGSFEVAGSCSGLSFLTVSVTLALLVGYALGWSLRSRLSLLLASIAFALAFNWLRIAVIIVIGEWTHMQSPLVEHHTQFGWILYAGALLGAAALIGHLDVRFRLPTPAQSSAPPTIVSRADLSRHCALAVTLLVVPVIAAWAAQSHIAGRLAGTTVRLPGGVGGWLGPRDAEFTWQPIFPGASSVARGVYSSGDSRILVDVRYFAAQTRGAKLIGFDTRATGDVTWAALGTSVKRTLASAGPRRVRATTLQDRFGSRWLLWQWYQIGSVSTPSVAVAKLTEGLRAFGLVSGSANVSLLTTCDADCSNDRAAASLERFATALGNALTQAAAPPPQQ